MSEVKLYTISSRIAPSKGAGKFIYILETETSKGIATLTRTEHFEQMTANEAYIFGLTEALKHINRHCTLDIFVESDFIYSALTKWLPVWSENNWLNSKGEEVANTEKWRELVAELSKHHVNYWSPRSQHEYKLWLKSEVQK